MAFPVPLDPSVCPSCGQNVGHQAIIEVPLLRHGGYGAARMTRTRHCPDRRCGWFLTYEVKEIHPCVP